jgi:GT2 family glycosyltransferase
VEPQEFDAYSAAHPKMNIEALPKDNGGFSYLMNQMVKRTLDSGERYFAFTDDDVTDLRDRESICGKFRRVANVEERLFQLFDFAESYGLAQLAVSFAGQSWAAREAIKKDVGAWGVHITDAQAIRAIGGYDESLPCFGDWDVSARLIQAGHRTARTNLITFVHKMKSHPGGAEDVYQASERVKEAAFRVSAKFPPGCATVRWVPSHGLHEVRFNWKRLSQGIPKH